MKSIATAGLVIISVFSLSGCIEETKSVDWWLAHPKETYKNLKSVRSLVAILIIVRTLSEHICLLNGERRLVYQ